MTKKTTRTQKRKLNKISKIISVLYAIIYIIFMYLLLSLNVLPNKYLIPIIVITLIISIILIAFMQKKNIKKKLKITSLVIAIILSIIYGIASYYMFFTVNFMNNIKDIGKETETFYVLANKESKTYNSKKDINKEDIYISSSTDKTYIKAQEKLENKFNVNFITQDSSDKLLKQIEKDKLIFISKSVYELLSEKKYSIDEKTKIIYKFKVIKTSKDITKKVDVFNEPFNIYISGIDSSGNISNVARSDVNMVVTVNPKTHKILLTSIPRDYYVTLHTYNSKDKLTHSGIYGINESVQTIEDLLNIDINYYCRVNFTTVIKLVDVIGGVTVDSDYNFTTHGMGVKYNFVKGQNNLDGNKALAFSRERKSFADGDRQRVKNQQKVLSAIIKKLTSSQTLLTNYSNILNTVNSSFQTNLSDTDIKKLIKKQINDMPSWDIEENSLTGADAHNITYTYGSQKLYVMQPDENSVNEAKEKINNIINTE